jgi:hypothetical protein
MGARRLGLFLLCIGLSGYYVGCSRVEGRFSRIFIQDKEVVVKGDSVEIGAFCDVTKAGAVVTDVDVALTSAKDPDGNNVVPTGNVILFTRGGGPGSKSMTIRRKFTFPPPDMTRTDGKTGRPVKLIFTANSSARIPENGSFTDEVLNSKPSNVTLP